MKHIWSVLCRQSIIDSRGNNISLIEVAEKISFKGPPEFPSGEKIALPLSMELVTLWTRNDPEVPETGRARLLIFSPSSELLNEGGFEYEVNLQGDYLRSRSMAQLEALPFVESGIYWYIVENYDEQNQEWREEASVPLELVLDDSEN